MGAFYLFHKNSTVNLLKAKNVFRKKGFKDPIRYEIGDYILLSYNKINFTYRNLVSSNNKTLYVYGTLIYKGCTPNDSIKNLFQDLNTNNVRLDQIIGHYCFLYVKNNTITIYLDANYSYNIYFDQNNQIISSSFLAILFSSVNEVIIDKTSIIELIITGNIISTDTYIKGIKKVDLNSRPNFRNIHFFDTSFIIDPIYPRNYSEALQSQINTLENYFSSLQNTSIITGTDIGITGGFDSRLLLALAIKFLKNIQLHSHYRRTYSKDLTIAEKLAHSINKNIISIPVKEPLSMNKQEAENNLYQSFFYFDGQPRFYHYWTEPYNTLNYRQAILGNIKLGLNGIGGEQYRNLERIKYIKRDRGEWVLYEQIYRNSGKCFFSSDSRDNILNFLIYKINKNRIVLPRHLALFDVKMFYNHIYNQSLRLIRTNAENQITFFLSPFTEYKITRSAENIIPFLGLSFKFQADLIRLYNPKLAKIKSVYGYDFYSGETLKSYIASLAKSLLPYSIIILYSSLRKEDRFFQYYYDKFEFCKKLYVNVNELNLPINLDKLLGRYNNANMVIAIGYIIETLKNNNINLSIN